tara:strand:+ start:145 stop:621 length:477 start_codon:yes stop_codon:yes gene_type:complete
MASEEEVFEQLVLINKSLAVDSSDEKVDNIALPGRDIPAGETVNIFEKGTSGELYGLHLTINSRDAVVKVSLDEMTVDGNPVVMDRDQLYDENRLSFWMPHRADISDPEQNTTHMLTPSPLLKFKNKISIRVFNPSATTAAKVVYGRMRLMTKKKNNE